MVFEQLYLPELLIRTMDLSDDTIVVGFMNAGRVSI